MIQVNLLPEEFRIREVRPQPLFSIGIALVMAVLFLVCAVSSVSYLKYKRQLISAESNLKALFATSNEVLRIQQNLEKVLRPEATAIVRAYYNELNWSQVFQLISSSIPKNVWLSELVVNDQPDRWELAINGFARPVPGVSSLGTVGEFTTKLKDQMQQFLTKEGVDAEVELLTTTKRKKADKLQILEFNATYVRKYTNGTPA